MRRASAGWRQVGAVLRCTITIRITLRQEPPRVVPRMPYYEAIRMIESWNLPAALVAGEEVAVALLPGSFSE